MIFYINYIKDNDKTVIGNVLAERYELHTLKDDDFKTDIITLYNENEEVAKFGGKTIIIEHIEHTKYSINVNIITY